MLYALAAIRNDEAAMRQEAERAQGKLQEPHRATSSRAGRVRHAAATELLDDPVMGDGLLEQGKVSTLVVEQC